MKQQNQNRRRSLLLPIIVFFIVFALWIYFVFVRSGNWDWTVPGSSDKGLSPEAMQVIEQLNPALEASAIANTEAADRLIGRIEGRFEGYMDGVVDFVDDLSSIGTRSSILVRLPGDMIKKDHRIENFVAEIFEKHVFSDESLQKDIEAEILAFEEDLKVSRNQLLAHHQRVMDQYPAIKSRILSHDAYMNRVKNVMLKNGEKLGKDSVYNGLISATLGLSGEYLATAIITRVIAAGATTTALTTTAAGGATVATTTTGGAGGSLGGPAGTVIGIAVGLVVGIAVDAITTKSFKRKMTREMSDYLETIKEKLLIGDETEPGLRDSVRSFVSDLNAAYTVELYQSL